MTSRKEKRRRVAWEVKFKEHKDVTMTALGAYKSKVTVTIVTDKDELYVMPGYPIRFDDPDELQAGVILIPWNRVRDIRIG
jgi:hypothetical protein